MRRRWPLVGTVGAVGLSALGGLVAFAAMQIGEPPGRPLNVLVVVWDTARADHMSLYGYPRPTTPRLDAWADRGMVFDRASSPGIWTLPAHASMFTGLPPETTGADERWLWLDGHHLTLAEHLANEGYATFSMAANALLCGETNLVQGMEIVLNSFRGKAAPRAREATLAKQIPGDRSQELAPEWRPPDHGATNAEWGRAAYKEAAPLIGRTLLAWLDQRTDDRPFFAFLNLMEAHTPRLPSIQSRRAVMADDPDLIDLGLATDAAHIQLHFYNFGVAEYTDREIAAIGGVYDASLRDLDDATGRLLDALDARGILEDTIVVLTSDHGENLGDHHLFNHRLALWDSLVHVPLVIWHPALGSGRVDQPVTTRDLFATVTRLAGVSVPDHLDGDLIEGPSPAVTWMARPLEREIETVKGVHPEVSVAPWIRSGHTLVDGSDKLISWSDGDVALYNLEDDPGEVRPIADPGRQEALLETLQRYRSGVAPYRVDDRGPEDDPAHVRASQKELEAHLRALGYTTGDP